MPCYAVFAWHYLAEGWEERNRRLILIAGRAADANVAGSGVYELTWYMTTVPEAEALRDLLRAVPDVTTGCDWKPARRKKS